MLTTLLLSLLVFIYTPWASAAEFMRLFPNSKPIIAAIMVEPLNKISPADAQKWLIEQAQIASLHKMDGLLIEFRGGGILSRDIPASELELMAHLTQKVITQFPQLVVGVEILWHFPGSTLKLAKLSGASFVRVDFFSDDVIADDQRVPIEPQALIKYRDNLKATTVALLTDIQVKYSKMVDSRITLQQSAAQAQRAGSDGVIVSGAKSGSSPDIRRLISARQGVRQIPVVIGSGFSLDNAKDILPLVDAVIVGTSISEKTGGPLLPQKVAALMKYVEDFRKQKNKTKDL